MADIELWLRNEAAAWTNLTPQQDARLREAADTIQAMREALEEAREYFSERADAEYHTDSPQPTGNEEMRLLVEIDAALSRGKQ